MKTYITFFLIFSVLFLTGCADYEPYVVLNENAHVYGFWGGVWHGFIMGWNLIMMAFSDNVAIYAPSNNGGWYAFGYWIGAAVFGGGAGRALQN